MTASVGSSLPRAIAAGEPMTPRGVVGARRQCVKWAIANCGMPPQSGYKTQYIDTIVDWVKEKANVDYRNNPTFLSELILRTNATNCGYDVHELQRVAQFASVIREAVDGHNNLKECLQQNHWKCVADRVKELAAADAELKLLKEKALPGSKKCEEMAEELEVQLVSTADKKITPLVQEAITRHNDLQDCSEEDHWECVANEVAELAAGDESLQSLAMPSAARCQKIANRLEVQLLSEVPPLESI